MPNNIISDFVRDFLTMKEGHAPNKNKVYNSFKSYYFEHNYNSEDIIKELLIYAQYYDNIRNSNTDLQEVNKHLESINSVRSTITYPYLLEVFNDFYRNKIISESEFKNVLEIIVSYIYRRNICNIPTNALNKIFAVMPREIRKLRLKGFSYIDAIVDFLMSRTGNGIFPRDDELKNNFFTGNMYSKLDGMSKLVLYKIEEYRHKEVVNIDDLSIEHILPQKLTAQWNIELGKQAFDVHRIYKDTIGNLTLTNYNSEMSNKSFQEKKYYYGKSNIMTTRNVAEYKTWTEKDILERAKKLFNIAKEIWKLPKDDYQNIGKERLIPNEEYSIKDNVIVTGYTPKSIIFDGEKVSVKTWKDTLVRTCKYLYDLDDEIFRSLLKKNNFKNILAYDKDELRSPKEIKQGIYIQTNYSAKDILSYIILFTEEFNISDLVYFEVS